MNTELENISYFIPIINRGMRIYFDTHLEKYHIGWGQHTLLEYIYENPGVIPQDLTDRYHTKKYVTTRVLKALYNEGYIAIKADDRDHRSKHLYPTPKSDEVIECIRQLRLDLSHIFMKNLSAEDLSHLEATLKHLYDNLTEAAKETFSHEQ